MTWDACNVIECFKIFKLIFNEIMMKHHSLHLTVKRFDKFKSDILSIFNYWLTILTTH